MPAFPAEILKLAEEVSFQAEKLTGMALPEIAINDGFRGSVKFFAQPDPALETYRLMLGGRR
jgi:hypothetical protein